MESDVDTDNFMAVIKVRQQIPKEDKEKQKKKALLN